MKIVPPEIDDSLLGRYIITNKVINISISQWVLQIEWDQINIISAQATNSPTESLEILEQNKSDLLMKLEMIKVDQNSDAYEDILNDIQKIDADIKLSKLK